MIELRELEESQVSVESVRGWCVEEQAMEMDIAVLQQVEELERKVTAASLQVKVKYNPMHCVSGVRNMVSSKAKSLNRRFHVSGLDISGPSI